MKTRNLAYPLIILLLLLGVGIVEAVSTEAQRKSRHFALAAAEAGVNGDPASSHELYKRAYQLDPGNLSAGYALALGNLSTLEEDDSVGMAESFRMMKEYVDAYPADSDEGEYYAYLCSMVGDYPEAVRVSKRVYNLYPNKSELLPTIADYYMRLQQLDSTLAYYNLYEEREGASTQLTMRKVLVHLMKQDSVAALREAGAGIAANPHSPDGYLLKGMLLPYVGYPDSALTYMLRAEEIAPDNGAVKISLAQYYEQQGDSALFDKYVYEALLLDDLELEQKLELLSSYVEPVLDEKKNTAQADLLFNTLRDQYPHEAQIQDFAARYSYAKGNYSEAAEQIGFAIDQDPENPAYRLQQLTYLLAGEKYAEAVKAYEATPQEIAADPSMMYLGAVAYVSDDRPDEAIAAARRMLKTLAPDSEPGDTLTTRDLKGLTDRQSRMVSDTYTLIGDTYYKMKDFPRMYLAYDNALVANPENVGALNNYAYYLSENNGDLDKALKMSKEAITLEPGNVTYVDTYAWVLFRRGEYKEALEYQRSVLDNGEAPSAEYYEHMGDILFMNGQPAEALEMWEKALPLDPDNELLRRKIKHKTYFYE